MRIGKPKRVVEVEPAEVDAPRPVPSSPDEESGSPAEEESPSTEPRKSPATGS